MCKVQTRNLLIALLLIGSIVNAQTPHPFQKEINSFQKADSIHMPDKGSILFVGSSSFNYWKDIHDYFPTYPIINRGFGGSSLTDLIYYANETILKYHPKQIYIYCGENDIAAHDSITPLMVLNRLQKLIKIIRNNLGASIPIHYVSIKPSVARWRMEARMVAANNLIKKDIASKKNLFYIDIHHAMLQADGIVRKDIFVSDSLHMNEKGYAIWQQIIAPTLLKTKNPIVNTDKGKIAGYLEGNIQIFKGIPFAAPPIGKLRWKAPEAVTAWKGIKNCQSFGPSPIQTAPVPFMCWSKEYLIPDKPISENCLYLNVWAKSTPKLKPVLVYIYGGGFKSGGAGCAIYDGKALAEKDIVFVSINYRVGVFGFLAHPELSKEAKYGASGNYALLDMVAALKWVKKNISAFGGDPNQVTIAGQSAGAFAVNYLCASPLAKGLFQSAIAQSGGSILPSSLRPNLNLEGAEKLGLQFATTMGAHSIDDLRKMEAHTLLNVHQGLSSPIEDGYFLPNSIANIYVEGKQNDVNLLLGWNEDDKVMGAPMNAINYIKEIEKKYGTSANQVLGFYPAINDPMAAESQFNLNRDETFAIQSFNWANLQNQTGKSPVYVYNFNRSLPAYNEATNFGAFHTGEVVYVFDNLKTVDRPWQEIDKVLAKQLSAYWVNFVKTGNPNGAKLVQWPQYTRLASKLLLMNQTIEAKELTNKKALELLTSIY